MVNVSLPAQAARLLLATCQWTEGLVVARYFPEIIRIWRTTLSIYIYISSCNQQNHWVTMLNKLLLQDEPHHNSSQSGRRDVEDSLLLWRMADTQKWLCVQDSPDLVA